MRKLLFAALLVVACTPAQTPPPPSGATSTITIFRGKHAGAFSGFTSKDAWNKHMHQQISIDGRPVLDVHSEEFASFEVPAARHLVEFTKYGGGSVSLETHPGERVFLWPTQIIGPFGYALNLSLKVLPCKQALEIGQGAKSAAAKDLLDKSALPEPSFPTSCADASH